ncbi:MAG: hypothetical protein ACJ72O_13310 [Marmoricola sp.]
MHIWEWRRSGVVAATLLLALTGLGLARADAVGTGDPVITAPTAGAAHYEGYTGPFTMDFDNAPIDTYDYTVSTVSPVAVVRQGSYAFNGADGLRPELSVAALPPGDYRFAISDASTHSHATSLDFTVRSGPAPKCSVVLPTTVRVAAPVVKVPARLAHLCTDLHVVYAAWKISHSTRGFTGSLVFDGTTTDTWTIFDGDPMGRYLVQPKSAQSSENAAVPQNSPTPLVRRDSRLRIGGSRTGGYTQVRTTLSLYSASANVFRPWTAAHVVLAYRTCSSCAWKPLRTLTTDQHGLASYRFRASSARDYRVTSAGTSQVWAALPRYGRY